MRGVIAIGMGLAAGAASAEGALVPIPYGSLRVPPATAVDFEGLVTHSTAVAAIDGAFATQGIAFGESFAGQTVGRQTGIDGGLHDHVTGDPTAPLAVVPGPVGRNLAIAPSDPHFGSSVMVATGPGGETSNVHGEGALALLFDQDQCQFGIKVYLDAFGPANSTAEAFGKVNMSFYDRNGTLIEVVRRANADGLVRMAFRRNANVGADIAGVLIQNLDAGGIAVDDIRISPDCAPAVS